MTSNDALNEMSLQEYIDKVKASNPQWKSNSRIIGRASEIYCYKNIKCLNCDISELFECSTNEKSKDQICHKCNKKYQIKCKKITNKQHENILKTKIFKTIGAEYNTTLKSISQDIDYLIILYDESYKILDIIHIDSKNITCDNIIPRKPLSSSAKRAGWQGCNLCFADFDVLKKRETKKRLEEEEKAINYKSQRAIEERANEGKKIREEIEKLQRRADENGFEFTFKFSITKTENDR